MPGGRYSPTEDRMAHHVANTYGGGKDALSIGYAVVNSRRNKKRRGGRTRTRTRRR